MINDHNANALGLAFTEAHRNAIDADVERLAAGMLTNVKSTGQAYSKDQNWIYTWFKDGSVTRARINRDLSGIISSYPDEPVIPAPIHNLKDFWAFAPCELAPNEIDYDWRADTNSYPFDTQVSRWHYNPHFPDLDKTHLKITKWLESKRPFVRFENGMICFKGSTVAYAAWHLDDLWSKGIIDDLNRVTPQGLVWIMFAEQQ